MSATNLYPPPPTTIPVDLTRASRAYRFQVFVLVCSLGVFLIVYLALVAGTAILTWLAATHPFGDRGEWNPFLNGVATLFCGMLFLFLLKGLFKGRKADYGLLLEIKPDEQPELFRFIHRLCEELHAPRPRKVYLSPEVNASVFSDTSLINLFIPPPKHLVIGLGLVNVVTLTEFKAVLAHEFGHFSQKSLGLSNYCYVADQILGDIVYARDSWDRWVNWCCRVDIRLSFPAWGLKGIVWGLRHALSGLYKGITLAHLSVKRQLEFNADDVAVSAAGSDAIVRSLCRLDFATEALNAAAHDLHTAADHEVFTADLFFHQTATADWLRQRRKDPNLGLPPEPPSDPDGKPAARFDPAKGEDGIPPMWRSHPPNHEREANAMRHYLQVEPDGRSTWLLFADLDGLKKSVTERFYTHGLRRREPYAPTDPADVQKFIDAEHAEMTYDPKYHGLYDDRFLKPGMLPAVVPELLDTEWNDGKIRDFLRDWPHAGLEERMKVHMSRRNDMSLLAGLRNGQLTLKGKTFTFRDEERGPRDIDSLYEAVDKELAEDHAVFERWDEECFSAHVNAAKLLAKREAGQSGWAEDLLRRYQFHLDTQELLRAILNDDYRMNSALRYLSGKSELPDEEYQALLQLLREICDSLAACVEKAQSLACPALTNVPEGTPLRRLIWEKDADLPQFDGGVNSIRFEWINDYLRKQNAAQDRLRRIHYKSLGQILALQEKIAGVWLQTQCEELPAVAELIVAPLSSAPAASIDGN